MKELVIKLSDAQRRWLTRVQGEWFDLMKPSAEPMGAHLFGSPIMLPSEALVGARLTASRHDALELLPKGGCVAELGTQRGRYARHILDVTRPECLHLFDLEFDTLRSHDPSLASDPRVHLHKGDSSTNLAVFRDGGFDWIYIDGDHSEAGVWRDANCACQKIKSHGIIVFNDYTIWSPMELTDYGIVTVVNSILSQGGWRVVYLALHPLMYCDIAIQRI